MELVEELEKVLQVSFPEARIEIERLLPEEQVSGLLVWNGFEGVEFLDRQNKVWDIIKEHFCPADQRRIASLFTFTSHEWKAMKEYFPVTA